MAGKRRTPNSYRMMLVLIFLFATACMVAVEGVYFATGEITLSWLLIDLVVYLSVIVAVMLFANFVMKRIMSSYQESEKRYRELAANLRQSEEKYRLITDSVTDVIWNIDERLNWYYISPSVSQMTGYSAEEISRDTVAITLTPESYELVVSTLADEVLKDRDRDPDRTINLQLDHRHKDGHIVHTDAAMRFLRDEDGMPVGVIGVSHDITRLKEAERALRESEQRYRTVLDNTFIGVLIYDGTGISYVNDRLAEIAGYPKDFFQGYGESFEPFTEGYRDLVTDNLYRVLVGQSVEQPFNVKFIRRNGETTEALMMLSMVTIGGNPSVIVMVHDVTEQRAYQEELERVNRELEGFAHAVSHDLRGPLMAIDVANETVTEIIADAGALENREEIEQALEIIDRSANKSISLIRDLLSLSRVGELPQAISEVSVSDTLDQVLAEHANTIRERGIEVSVSDDLGTVMANPAHVYQVFGNLIGNAILHNDNERPVVEVRCLEESGPGHRYLVRDNGSGIEEEYMGKLFTPFFKRKEGESGIGLSIVERIVELYDGRIEAYNDDGACFEFVLKDFHAG